mmetsp:Transcript_40386/g.107004  ORF Transcript_40386/g.107004 Transcript_40386/m.107004 type:complete len:314 (+) Transcript_40386:400-1341(+)
MCPSEPNLRREGRTSSRLDVICSTAAEMMTEAISGAELAVLSMTGMREKKAPWNKPWAVKASITPHTSGEQSATRRPLRSRPAVWLTWRSEKAKVEADADGEVHVGVDVEADVEADVQADVEADVEVMAVAVVRMPTGRAAHVTPGVLGTGTDVAAEGESAAALVHGVAVDEIPACVGPEDVVRSAASAMGGPPSSGVSSEKRAQMATIAGTTPAATFAGSHSSAPSRPPVAAPTSEPRLNATPTRAKLNCALAGERSFDTAATYEMPRATGAARPASKRRTISAATSLKKPVAANKIASKTMTATITRRRPQ